MTDHPTQQVQVTPRTEAGRRLLLASVNRRQGAVEWRVSGDLFSAILAIEAEAHKTGMDDARLAAGLPPLFRPVEAARSVPVAEGLREALERLTAVVDESAPGEFRWKVRNEVSAAQAALAYTLPDPAEVPARPICEDCGGSGAGQLGQPCSICNGSGLLATAGEYDWDKMRRDGIAVPFATPPDPAEGRWDHLDDGTDPQGKAAAEEYVESIGPAEGQEPAVIDVDESDYDTERGPTTEQVAHSRFLEKERASDDPLARQHWTPTDALCDHGMSAHGDDGCIHCDCKVPGFGSGARRKGAGEPE